MKSFDYNSVNLVSRQISTIMSRDEIDTSVYFCGRKLTIPIIASPMKDVCDGYVAQIMIDNGAFGIIHRFCSIAQQVEEYRMAPGAGCALGINDDWYKRFLALHMAGCRVFCIDVALGSHINMIPACESIHKHDATVNLIVGNVVSCQGFNFLEKLPCVKAIRVGVGGGSGCTTTRATGIFYPSVSLIEEVYNNRLNKDISIIADGGIKIPADLCKALAVGADTICLGSLIANTKESPAEKRRINNAWYTVYRGSASQEIQLEYKKTPKYIEGKQILIEYQEKTIEETLSEFINGLKSSMSYCDAHILSEYKKNVEYIPTLGPNGVV